MPHPFKLEDLDIPDQSEYHRLIERCADIRPLRFEDREHLIREGEASREVYVVLRGICVVEPRAGDLEQRSGRPLAVIETEDPSSPAFFGELAGLVSGLRIASVTSSGDTYALCIEPEHLVVITEEFPLFTRMLCGQFSKRLKDALQKLREHEKLLEVQTSQVVRQPGEALFTAGDPADTLYRLIDGTLVREVDGDQEPVSPDALFLGFLDPIAYFTDGQHASTVKAQTEVTVAAIPKSSKRAVIRNMPELLLHCLGRP